MYVGLYFVGVYASNGSNASLKPIQNPMVNKKKISINLLQNPMVNEKKISINRLQNPMMDFSCDCINPSNLS
jgi:hypothetical protein